MSEIHNFCDAPNGACLESKRISSLENENRAMKEALEWIGRNEPQQYDGLLAFTQQRIARSTLDNLKEAK